MKSELDSSNHQKESTGTTRRALLERSALAIGSGVLAAAIPSGTAASPAETATTVGAEAFAANHALEPLPFDASKLQGLSKRGETAMGSLAGNVSSNASSRSRSTSSRVRCVTGRWRGTGSRAPLVSTLRADIVLIAPPSEGTSRRSVDSPQALLRSLDLVLRFAAVALPAVQMNTDLGTASSRRRHPEALDPRRIVAHMLKMAACQLGHPVPLFVPVTSDDRLAHRSSSRRPSPPPRARHRIKNSVVWDR